MMVLQIPQMQARDKLMMMDAAVYGNRIHGAKSDQITFDMMRGRVESVAYPRTR